MYITENITEHMYLSEESIHDLCFYAYKHNILDASKSNSNQEIIKCVMLKITCFFDEE